jgi:hypothetical protein
MGLHVLLHGQLYLFLFFFLDKEVLNKDTDIAPTLAYTFVVRVAFYVVHPVLHVV